jgi:Ras family
MLKRKLLLTFGTMQALVKYSEAKRYADKMGYFAYVECSAKANIGIDEVSYCACVKGAVQIQRGKAVRGKDGILCLCGVLGQSQHWY